MKKLPPVILILLLFPSVAYAASDWYHKSYKDSMTDEVTYAVEAPLAWGASGDYSSVIEFRCVSGEKIKAIIDMGIQLSVGKEPKGLIRFDKEKPMEVALTAKNQITQFIQLSPDGQVPTEILDKMKTANRFLFRAYNKSGDGYLTYEYRMKGSTSALNKLSIQCGSSK